MQNLKPKKDKVVFVQDDVEIETKIPRFVGEKWAKLSQKSRQKFKLNECPEELLQECSNQTRKALSHGSILPYQNALMVCDKFDLDDDLIICNKNERNPEDVNLPEFVDEDFARLFGFLIGDGGIRKSSLSFCCGIDENQNQFYANLFRKYFGWAKFNPEKRSKNKERKGMV